MRDQGFPKAHRILRRPEIREVYDGGTPYRNAGFHLFVRRTAREGPTRFAVTATRGLGKAVVRNRLKRWSRETFRLNSHRLAPGHDMVLNIHRRMAQAPRREFDRLFLDALRKTNILED